MFIELPIQDVHDVLSVFRWVLHDGGKSIWVCDVGSPGCVGVGLAGLGTVAVIWRIGQVGERLVIIQRDQHLEVP